MDRVDIGHDGVLDLGHADRLEIPREAFEFPLISIRLRVDLDRAAAPVEDKVVVDAHTIAEEELMHTLLQGHSDGELVLAETIQVGVHRVHEP